MTDLPTDAIRMCIDRVYIPFPTAATINAPEEATAELQGLLDALKEVNAEVGQLQIYIAGEGDRCATKDARIAELETSKSESAERIVQQILHDPFLGRDNKVEVLKEMLRDYQ